MKADKDVISGFEGIIIKNVIFFSYTFKNKTFVSLNSTVIVKEAFCQWGKWEILHPVWWVWVKHSAGQSQSLFQKTHDISWNQWSFALSQA